MKILVVTNDLPPNLNANSAIIYHLADMLYRTYGQEIIVLGLQSASGDVPHPDYLTISIEDQYRYTNLVPAHFSKIYKFIRILSHPSIWPMFLRYSFLRYPLYGLYKKKIRQVLKEIPDIDCAIAVSEPVDIPYAFSKLNLDVPWVSYRLDPWATHYLRQHDKKARADEDAANQACAAVFVQPAVYPEYLDGKASLSLEKLYTVEFPNLRLLPKKGFRFSGWREECIHCAYVGQLYSDIRNPAFMLKLFAEMREAGIILHVIGSDTIQADDHGIANNIIFHGRVSYEDAIAYMQAADVLVNLGNLIPNQMPSKVIDYLSTGKPILNIYKIKQCPSLFYMKKHPIAFSIYEEDGIDERCIHQAVDFCRKNKGIEIPFEEMEKIYKKCTPSYVGHQVYGVLRNICSQR